MITLTKDEIVSSSKASKNFGQLLNRLKSGEADKIIISKNNELEAVMITFQEYELMKQISDFLEHLEISQIIKSRKDNKATIGLDKLITDSGFSRKDLEK
jgi:PHD/YefM family antitoxin component YafN of YafNO toxin-antitoxin module